MKISQETFKNSFGGSLSNLTGKGVTEGKDKPKQPKARGVEPKVLMNNLETAYAQYLDLLKHSKEIRDWKFEPFNIRLADRTFYKIDFLVIAKDLTIELHETKGHWTDDALVKFKMAAGLFPFFVFKAIKKKDGQFYVEREL